MSGFTFSRRGFLGGLSTAALMAVGAVPARAQSTPPDSVSVTDLGIAMTTVNVRYSKAALQADGRPVMYAFSDGRPISLNVVDLETGTTIDAHSLAPYTVGASIAIHPDSSVYFSVRNPTPAPLFRYQPNNKTVTTVAPSAMNEVLIRSLTIPDNGIVYGSTYSHAKAFSYDPDTGAIRDFGSVVTDGDYAWGLAYVDGQLWVGTGIGRAHLVLVDTTTGEHQPMPLPSPISSSATYIYAIGRRNNLVFVYFSPNYGNTNAAVYDLTARQWLPLDTVPHVVGLNAITTECDPSGAFYFPSDGTLRRFDTATRSITATSFGDSPLAEHFGATRSLDVLPFSDGTQTRWEIVGAMTDGRVWRYDPVSEQHRLLDPALLGSPATVHSIGRGPEGNIYAGAFLSSGVLARIEPQSGAITQLRGPHQTDTIISHDGHLLLGEYPEVKIHAATPGPWIWGDNPKELFTLPRGAPHYQDRPVALVSAGQLAAVGTVPAYGELGGALVTFELNGNRDVYRNIIPNHSIVALAYQRGYIYGATSVYGGLDSDPTEAEACLFIWDVNRQRLAWSGVPVPRAKIITSLTFDNYARLWGITNTGTLFQFDPSRRRVTLTEPTGLTGVGNWWGLGDNLYYRPIDRALYGNAATTLFRINPRTLDVTRIATNAKVSTLALNGDIYYSDGTKIFRCTPRP